MIKKKCLKDGGTKVYNSKMSSKLSLVEGAYLQMNVEMKMMMAFLFILERAE